MRVKEIKNILLADDDEDDRYLFRDALNELFLGTVLTAAHDGAELIKYLETVSTNLPDILFLDLNMPRKNGFDCLKEIKEHTLFQKLPVVIYSTSSDEEKLNLLYQQGAHYYICKPTNYEELKSVVHKAITLLEQNQIQAPRENFFINKLKPTGIWKKHL